MNKRETKPVVSVIVPTHNRPEYLRRALNSVKKQTISGVESIVVDDASSVDLEDVLQDFPDVIYLRNKTNKGPCYSRNRGLKHARGKFINFLDDDDILYPQKIEKQVDLFRKSTNQNLGMVTCHTKDCRSGETKIKYNKLRGYVYTKLLYSYALTGNETVLYKRKYLVKTGGFDEDLESSQEYDLFIRMAKNYKIDYVDDILTEECKSENQISVNFDKKLNGARYLYNKYKNAYMEEGCLFWIKMRFKFWVLYVRFLVGKYFGERLYRLLLRD